MYDITLKGTDLIEHTICYKYNNIVIKEVNQQHYIEPKEYFKDYFKLITKFVDDDADHSNCCMCLLIKISDDMILNDFEEYFFKDDRITFSFDCEEEALYFKLKYNV